MARKPANKQPVVQTKPAVMAEKPLPLKPDRKTQGQATMARLGQPETVAAMIKTLLAEDKRRSQERRNEPDS